MSDESQKLLSFERALQIAEGTLSIPLGMDF